MVNGKEITKARLILANQFRREFLQKRPLMQLADNVSRQVRLLIAEVEELNGGDEAGIFSEKNIENIPGIEVDYRQQEISDVIIFSLGLVDVLGEEADFDHILSRVDYLSSLRNFRLIENTVEFFPPFTALSVLEETNYLTLRGLLNRQVAILGSLSTDDYSAENLIPIVNEILALSFAIHCVMGINTVEAVKEKVRRNMVKFPEEAFALEEGHALSAKDVFVLYLAMIEWCNDTFDGPKDETGVRPKIGTTEFYEYSVYKTN